MENENIVEALNFLKDRIEEVNTKVDQLNEVLFKQVLEPAEESLIKADYEDFSERYGEKLGPVLDQYRAIYPYEEDPMKQIYDESKNVPDEEAFVAQVAEALSEEIDNIKKSLGMPDAEVKDVDVAEGTVTLEDDNQTAKVESEELKDAVEEKPEETINSPEEIKAFEKKLEAYL